jgi:hypothetical protein
MSIPQCFSLQENKCSSTLCDILDFHGSGDGDGDDDDDDVLVLAPRRFVDISQRFGETYCFLFGAEIEESIFL